MQAWEACALPLGDTRMGAHGITDAWHKKGRPTTRAVRKLRSGAWLLGRTNAADGGAAVGALALGDGLAILGGALDRILHFLLGPALNAVRFNCHWYLVSSLVLALRAPTLTPAKGRFQRGTLYMSMPPDGTPQSMLS